MFTDWVLLSKENILKVQTSRLLLLILIETIIVPSLGRQFTRKPPKLIKVYHKFPQRPRRDRHALGPESGGLVLRPCWL